MKLYYSFQENKDDQETTLDPQIYMWTIYDIWKEKR